LTVRVTGKSMQPDLIPEREHDSGLGTRFRFGNMIPPEGGTVAAGINEGPRTAR
jgi:hypothetical protein